MPWPPQRKPEITASIAIGHRRSGVVKSQIAGTTEMPNEQQISTGRAPIRSTARPHSRAEAIRTMATPTPWAATTRNPARRLVSR